MKTNPKFLLPHGFKPIGWALFVPALILGVLFLTYNVEPSWLSFKMVGIYDAPFMKSEGSPSQNWFRVVENNFADELLSLLALVGGLFILLAKEKREDEFISRLRLESILWASIANAILMMFGVLFFYDFTFFYVMVLNLFLLFLLFGLRFQWVLYLSRRSGHEE